jgi:hypothetical protein
MNAHTSSLLAVGILAILSLAVAFFVLVLEADLDRRINRLKDMLLSLELSTHKTLKKEDKQ